jgi:hypothetical protein
MDAFTVIINSDRELLLGSLLSDHVLIEMLLDFQGFRELVGARSRLVRAIVFQNRVADSDALVADISTRVVAGG